MNLFSKAVQTVDMKKGWICAAAAIVLGAAVMTGLPATVASAQEVATGCKAAYLMDDASGVPMYAREETKRLPIASMCKIMTLLLALESADAGELSFDEEITVSEHAA